jgi:hypothetical protein
VFNPGDLVKGFIYTRNCERVAVTGEFLFRTDDPEEYIQDIVIRDKEGAIHYIDEQEARPA